MHPPSLGVFAEALAQSPVWGTLPPVVLAVRSDEKAPGVAVLGRFNDEEAARMEALIGQLGAVLPDVRYVDYAQAEDDCARLGEKLFKVLGARRSDAQFLGIPRGGLIVLGMLSYVMDLSPDQIVGVPAASDPTRPLVIVDDCMLTGARLRETLARCPDGQEIIAAALYAAPALGAAVEAEGRVAACLRAQDLRDYGPDRFGNRYPEVQAEWQRRGGDQRFWVGMPEHVCFAWTEPDVGVWNASGGRFENGLHIIPPDACLKNKYSPVEQRPLIQHQSIDIGPLVLEPHTFVASIGEEILFANTSTQTCVSLSGSGATMWTLLCERSSFAQVEAELLRTYDVEAHRLRADLYGLVDHLVSCGMFSVKNGQKSLAIK